MGLFRLTAALFLGWLSTACSTPEVPAPFVTREPSRLLKILEEGTLNVSTFYNTTDFYVSVGFGCDFYLPYFKLVPEVKFCFGITDAIEHDRPDLEDEPDKLKITRSLRKALSRMVVFTFYFE